MTDALDFVSREWQAMAAGAGIYGAVRELVGLGLRVYAARLRGDADKGNDAVADVLDDAAKRLESKPK
jgi:hypothetical protein